MNKKKLTPEERRIKKEQLFHQRSEKIYRKTSFVFLAFLAAAGASNLFIQDKTYSETENRMLAQKPDFSLNSLVSGQFMSDMETYITDQFFFRDQWINLKLMEDIFLGKKESNGVYLGNEQYLLEIPDTPDTRALDRSLDAIRAFSARHEGINTVMSLVPNAAYICDQLVPKNAPVRDQGKDIQQLQEALKDSVSFVDLTDTLRSHKEEELYYQTDHHWTSLGARYAFETLSSVLGIENPAKDYIIYPVTHDFSGTLSAKSGYNQVQDTIEIYVPEGVNTQCVVNYVSEEKKSASPYDSEALQTKDKYEVFLGGNHPRVDISTPLEEKKNLLLLKDSYANCLVPFLIPYYRNIIVIEPRYYYDDLDKLINDNQITDILFLYNVNTFMTDNSLADALEPEEASS